MLQWLDAATTVSSCVAACLLLVSAAAAAPQLQATASDQGPVVARPSLRGI